MTRSGDLGSTEVSRTRVMKGLGVIFEFGFYGEEPLDDIKENSDVS